MKASKSGTSLHVTASRMHTKTNAQAHARWQLIRGKGCVRHRVLPTFHKQNIPEQVGEMKRGEGKKKSKWKKKEV